MFISPEDLHDSNKMADDSSFTIAICKSLNSGMSQSTFKIATSTYTDSTLLLSILPCFTTIFLGIDLALPFEGGVPEEVRGPLS